MINIDLFSNIQGKSTNNVNSNKEIKSTINSEVKDNFKSFLKKEVKKDISKEDKSVPLNNDTKGLKTTENIGTKEIKETLKTSLEKVKDVIVENSNGDDIEVEDIIELINLLSNLLVTGDSKVNIDVNVEEIVDSNLLIEGNLDDIKSLISEVNNFEESTTFNEDNKGIIENIKSLGDLINNMLETGEGSTDINLDKESLNKEILNLLNSISEKDMENLNLPENQNKIKEIISSLVNIKNYNENLEENKEPISLDKKKINLDDSTKGKIQSIDLKDESNSSELENLSKGNTVEKVSEEINKKEIKETLETSLEKVKSVMIKTSNEYDIKVEDIVELTNILSNLLVTEDSKVNIDVNVGKIVDSNLSIEGNLDDIKNLLSEVKGVVNKLKESTTFNEENKGIIENIKSLGDLINNMLETGKGSSDISLDKESLNKEILNLLNFISEKDMENLNLPENQNKIKEIISSLVNIKNYNENLEGKKQPISLDKEKVNLGDRIQEKIQSIDLKNESNNSELGNSLKGNTGQEASEEINAEDKILSKFLSEENKVTFGNTLTSYDRFKNNSIDVIQKPEVINSQTMDNDIIKNVKYMMKNNIEELTVKIYPKELGELTIKILSEEGIMKAEIKATSKETYSILNANIAEIKNSLSDQNIKIQDVQVAIYNDDTTFFSGKQDSRENQKDSRNSNNEVDSINVNDKKSIITEDKIESNINLLA